MTTEIVRFADSVTGADVELSVDKIKEGLCPMATNQEAVMFLELCRHMGLNPWVKDAYLIKYDDKRPATMVVGKDAFTKRADSNPHFAGIESGVIVQMGDKLEYRKGTLVLKGEVIVGGWAKVARSDRKIDMDTTVTFDEYNTKRGVWNNMPAVMIEKCAIVKALGRRSRPLSLVCMARRRCGNSRWTSRGKFSWTPKARWSLKMRPARFHRSRILTQTSRPTKTSQTLSATIARMTQSKRHFRPRNVTPPMANRPWLLTAQTFLPPPTRWKTKSGRRAREASWNMRNPRPASRMATATAYIRCMKTTQPERVAGRTNTLTS